MDQFGDVKTVGEFQQYGTKAKALSQAKRLAILCQPVDHPRVYHENLTD